MNCNYDLPMASKVHLVQQSQSSENVYYMEQTSINDRSEIIMNLILESEPSDRLKKLIRIGRLNEAEVNRMSIYDKFEIKIFSLFFRNLQMILN